MAKLKLQFLLFFAFLAALFGFFIDRSFEQIRVEEKRLWQGTAEKAFNQMQARISDFLTAEDARPFGDYDAGGDGRPTPLSLIPRHDARGLVGYFQINPDGQFTSPYLVRSRSKVFTLQTRLRRNIHRTLQELTESFRIAPAKPDLSALSPQKLAKKTAGGGDIIDLESPAQPPAQPDKDEKTDDVFQSRKIVQRSASAPKQIYPNPLMKQTQAPAEDEPEEEISPGADDKTESMIPDDGAPAPSPTQSASSPATGDGRGAPSPVDLKLPEDAPGIVMTDVPETPPVLDPFRARLIDRKYVVFYRKAWLDQKMYIQGFVVRLEQFYDWLMQQSFDDSGLSGFTLATLELPRTVLASHGSVRLNPARSGVLFERQLGYPLNRFTWRVRYDALPKLPTRRMLNVFTLAVAVALTGGLYLLYRTSAAQILLSQKRQDFVSAVTHELKTPLTSIRMSAEMLREGWVTDEKKRDEYYGVISKESERLSNLINNVLQLARLEKKNAKLNIVTESPNSAFHAMAAELEAFVTSQGFDWAATAQPDLPPIRFDSDIVKQIAFNLVDNSVKFAQFSERKLIRMELSCENDEVVWSVTDSGPGLPKKELHRIFEKFYRVENELTRKTKGTGIGLAMAKMMAENMGARIEARNVAPHGLSIRLIFSTVAT